MWRWFAILPVKDLKNVVTLGESATPLLPAPRGSGAGLRAVLHQRGGRHSQRELQGARSFRCCFQGQGAGHKARSHPLDNAAGALAADGSRAGIEIWAFMPKDTPDAMKRETLAYGTKVILVRGLINDAGRDVCENANSFG